MTRTSAAGAEVAALADAHGVGLHRLAAMLTADPQEATELTALTLRGGAGSGPPGAPLSPDRLRADLVRRYLRSAPRRAEGVHTPGGDAGDVLRRLSPRARAASALTLVERWSTDDTAAALKVSSRKVAALVPEAPGLELALTGLADRHALTGPDLRDALLETVREHPSSSGPGRRRLGWVAAAALAVAVTVGYVVDRDGPSAPAHDRAAGAAPASDLTQAGWRLNDDGDPPRTAMGLHLRETVALDKGRRTATVDLPLPANMGVAAFGVLWCDMPPAQDDNLDLPAGVLTVGDTEIHLPCAGHDGTPPVSQVVALPTGDVGVLKVTGDLPGKGSATLAVYTETDQYHVPAARDTRADAPPVAEGAVVIDVGAMQPSVYQGHRMVEAVSVGHDSTIQVWAGRAGSVAVNVDGIPATDDGDVTAILAMIAAWEDAGPDDHASMAEPRDFADWSTQQADLREGRWLVPAAGQARTFDLPAGARPEPGERRTVVVEVFTENVEDHLQVTVTDAQQAELDAAPLTALVDPVAPAHVLGHRLAGEWQVPADGHLRELRLTGSADLPEDVVLLLSRAPGADLWFSWGEGLVSRGGDVRPLWLSEGLDSSLLELRQPWYDPPPGGPGPLSVAAPPALGHPPQRLRAYVPVPYEEFDFAAAAVPSDAWPAGSAAPPESHLAGFEAVDVVGPQDLEDGTATLTISDGSASIMPGTSLAVRVTTEGVGRIRFLVDGRPGDVLWATDGWWSSWTDQAVTSEFELVFPGQFSSRVELSVVVEDYEDFSIEVLSG